MKLDKILSYLILLIITAGCGDKQINSEIVCEPVSKAEIVELMEIFINENVNSNQVIVRTPIEDIKSGFGDNYVLDNLRVKDELIDSLDTLCMKEQSLNTFKIDWKEVENNHIYISLDDFKAHGNFNHYLNETLGASGFCFISLPYFSKGKDIAVIGLDLNHEFEQSSGFIIYYKKENNMWKRVHYYQHKMS